MSAVEPAWEQPLLRPYEWGGLVLPNRVVMAPMTRARADNAALAPTELHATYYAQRAGAGLIVTEGTWVSADAIGALNVPGLYSDAQVEGWTKVASAVHAAGGTIFAQLAHTGAASHPEYRDGHLPAAPSAVNPSGTVFTARGLVETVTPRALTLGEIDGIVADYRAAALNARRSGFDGIEVHAQRGYLIAQFLNPALNVRTDAYGGSLANRGRFLFEILDAVVEVWGPGRVGIKFAPYANSADGTAPDAEILAGYEHVTARLNDYPLAYVHLMMTRRPNVTVTYAQRREALEHFRPRYRGTLVANASLDQEGGNAVIAEGLADLVSYGLPFIANPDLPARFAAHLDLAPADRETFYQGGARGYIDYPAADRAGAQPLAATSR
jgi:N-ethylmaleimide reductase